MLSTYQFMDVYIKFRFLLIDVLNNITRSVVGYAIFLFFITLTSYIALIFNWKLINPSKAISEATLVDSQDEIRIQFGFLYYGYLAFSVLLIGFGLFLIVKPIQENYPIEELPNGLFPYTIAIIIIGLGVVLTNDALKLKRAIKESKHKI